MSLRLVLCGVIGLVPAAAWAHGAGGHPADPDLHVNPSLEECSVQFAPELTQSAFGRFAREFGSISAFKLGSGPPTLGRWGVAIGIEYMRFSVDEKADAWNDTFAHPDAYHELGSDLAFPKLRVRVGVHDRVDVGAFYAENWQADYGWIGLESKVQLLRQDEKMPLSLAVRGAYTKTIVVDDMDMHAFTVDVAVGRTFWGRVTPYVGLGSDAVFVRETTDMVDLDREVAVVPHAVGGVEVKVWHVAVGAEASLAAVNSLQVQLAAVF